MPSPIPAPAMASVTRARRPAAVRHTTAAVVGGDVDPVEDQLHHDVVTGERGSCDAGIAVVERAHCVEEMGHCPCTQVERDVRLLCGRIGVPARDGDPAEHEMLDHAPTRRGAPGRE